MRKVKLLLIELRPVVGIFEGDQMIGESEAPPFKIYPGNDLTDVVKQIKKELEVELGPTEITTVPRETRRKERKSLQGQQGDINNRNRKKPRR